MIIIDDMGHSLSLGRAAIDLPGALTFAILPYTPHGAALARRAHRNGREVMLHAPMSNRRDHPLGPAGLTPELTEPHFRARLAVALRQVPHVSGVNNHMGSELTEQPEQMRWLMEELRDQGLYFVDSRTSADSVAAQAAAELGIPHLVRQVFLDNEREQQAISARFEELLEIARQRGLAVAIGHPYPETIEFLQGALPGLPGIGIELLSASAALDAIDPDIRCSAAGDCADRVAGDPDRDEETGQEKAYRRTSMPAAAM